MTTPTRGPFFPGWRPLPAARTMIGAGFPQILRKTRALKREAAAGYQPRAA